MKKQRSILLLLMTTASLFVLTGCACRHQFGEWTVDRAASCSSEGVLIRVCTKCDEAETAPIPMTEHSYGEWTTTRESTCTLAGTQERSCTACAAKEETGLALAAHTFGEWEVIAEATCEHTGSKTAACTVCGQQEDESIPLADHAFTWTTTQSATCLLPGRQTGTCSVCAVTEETEIAAAGHNWAAATCLAPKTCSNCGETEGNTGDHSWKSATCTAPETCSACGLTNGSAPGHSYGSSGKCSVCGKKMVSISLKIPSVGTFNAYASLVVTNHTDGAITFPKLLSINGKLCNSDNGYTVGAGQSATLTYYRAIIPAQRYDQKSYDMYLDNHSIGYCVINWNGTQYYAEYGVNGITTFYRGNVNGPA